MKWFLVFWNWFGKRELLFCEVMALKDILQKLPPALQKQVLFRMGSGVLFFMLFLIIRSSIKDLYFILPCVLCGVWLFGSGIWLLHQGAAGDYIRLQGECVQVDTVGLRKRVIALYIALETGIVKITVRQRIRKLRTGDTVIVYLTEKTPVYEKEGICIIGSYLALEIQTGGSCEKGKRNDVPVSSRN